MTLTAGQRTTTVPAIDTNQAAGGELDLTYWADDMTAGQTVGNTTTSFSHDPIGRADTQTTTVTGGATTTLTQYYAGGGDSPAWTSTGTGAGSNWNWYLPAPTGGLALTITGTVTGTGTTPASATLALINPHGDITATIPNTTNVTATQISGITINDEYGQTLTSDQPQPYQWLGAAQRSNNGQAGIIQMGARQYNPTTGRFLTLDPVPGGNPNPYTYPTDPVNQYDLDGQFSIGSLINTVVNAVIAPVRAVAQVAKTVFRTVTSVARNAWRAVTHIAHTAARTIRTIASTGAKWAGRAARNAGRRIRSSARATVNAGAAPVKAAAKHVDIAFRPAMGATATFDQETTRTLADIGGSKWMHLAQGAVDIWSLTKGPVVAGLVLTASLQVDWIGLEASEAGAHGDCLSVSIPGLIPGSMRNGSAQCQA